jgi:hypothetical protein
MRARLALMTVFIGGVAQATEVKSTPPPASTAPQRDGVIDPKADAALHRMSDYMSSLKTFKVDTTTIDQNVTTDGQKIEELQQSKLIVQRPGAFRIDRVSPVGHSIFRADGKQFAAYNQEKNVYATAAAPAKLDAAVDELRDRLHIDAPGGDLIVSNPYQSLIDGTVTGRYIGLEPIDGVQAHHLAIAKKDVDWQIWIKDGPEAVPLRYVITTKDLAAQPQFTIEMRNWEPNASVPRDSFAFTPPAGAKRVDFSEHSKTEREPGGQP